MIDKNLKGRSGIYAIVHTESERMYIGSAVNLYRRISEHAYQLNKNTHCNQKLQKGWNKYGEGAFKVRILDYVMDKKELFVWEQQWMDSLKPFYNINLFAINCQGRILSPKSRTKMSEAHKGRVSPNKGKRLSEETKKKISLAHKGKILSKETRLRMSKSRTGKINSVKTRERISEAKKGKSNGLKGKIGNTTGYKHTEASLLKMSQSHQGQESYWKGKRLSEETKSKMAVAQKERRLREKNQEKPSV